MYQKILVPLDGSELAECVLPHVEGVVKGCQAKEVIFVRVAEPVPLAIFGEEFLGDAREWQRIGEQNQAAAENYLKRLVGQLQYGNIKIQSEVLMGGRTADIIADYATKNEVDLIVIATHGRSGISRWVWGSVADRVLRAACAPVLMVRPPGCVPAGI
ncbi:universal stress protein [Chloroflexota bacterium]